MKNRLLRYTNLPVLLDVLSNRRLTLLNPASWEDRNDSFYIELYKKKKSLKTILALCFTGRPETFHHWKVFSNGHSGVCIQFKKDALLECFKKFKNIEFRDVDYCLIRELHNDPPVLDELPFLKRHPYKDEDEFRVIYKNKSIEMESKKISIDLNCIEKITLSPWLPLGIVPTIKNVIKSIPCCEDLRVGQTTLIENKVWKNIATKNND